MKKFKILLILFLVFFISPVKAESSVEYKDIISTITGEKEDKVTVYLFHQEGCPHCEAEIKFLDSIKNKYDIVIKKYEISSTKNNEYYKEAKKAFLISKSGVPFTVIGTKYFIGYGTSIGYDIEEVIKNYLDISENTVPTKKIPFLGTVKVEDISIPLVAAILGFLDGFNPCAMWILLFLINMLFNMKNKKRMWILGLTFLFSSAFVYFLAMLGINTLFNLFDNNIIKILIALVALIGGTLNIRSYIKIKDDGCHVVDAKKRKKYFEKIKKFTTEKSFILALIGVIALAFSVNIVELACSAGFPTIFLEILNINNITGLKEILYILFYILFFLIDDILIFVISMVTLNITGISTKYNKLSHLIGGILMIIIGLLLIFKPDWLMLNF